MTVESTIDYEGLAQEAMRGVVRQVLIRAAKSGLPGDHHFYISFDTEAPGISLSKRLKEKYPREMTIVLQHRFWDLSIGDDRFEVKLTFDGIPERLVVPFAAIKVFFDPSVRFGLQFEEGGAGSEPRTMGGDGPAPRTGATRVSAARKTTRTARKASATDKRSDTPERHESPNAPDGSLQPGDGMDQANVSPIGEKAADSDSPPPAASSNDQAAPAKAGGAEIVSLDKFRKK